MAFNKKENKKPIETKENKKSTKNNILTDKQNNKKVSGEKDTNNKQNTNNKVSNNNKKQPIKNNKQEKPMPKFIKGGKTNKKSVCDV